VGLIQLTHLTPAMCTVPCKKRVTNVEGLIIIDEAVLFVFTVCISGFQPVCCILRIFIMTQP
jgi:hypothetical protein